MVGHQSESIDIIRRNRPSKLDLFERFLQQSDKAEGYREVQEPYNLDSEQEQAENLVILG